MLDAIEHGRPDLFPTNLSLANVIGGPGFQYFQPQR
jgi:hypothetical protein